MKSAKLGAMFLISVLALAGIGMGYAAWTDTITIEGTVNTGNVDLAVRGYSGTWVWKLIATHELIYHHGIATIAGLDPAGFYGNPDYLLVSYAVAGPGDGDDTVTMTFDNLFPCQDFYADVIFHYEGSIPAMVFRSQYITLSNVVNGPQYGDGSPYLGDNWMEDHWLWKHPDGMNQDPNVDEGMWIDVYYAIDVVLEDPADPTSRVISYERGDPIVGEAVQLHYCDYIVAEVHAHIIQDNIFQGCSGDFDLDVYAMQWNEYNP